VCDVGEQISVIPVCEREREKERERVCVSDMYISVISTIPAQEISASLVKGDFVAHCQAARVALHQDRYHHQHPYSHLRACAYVCVYIYIHTCTRTRTRTHTHTHTHALNQNS
jgi:hypothetical protein